MKIHTSFVDIVVFVWALSYNDKIVKLIKKEIIVARISNFNIAIIKYRVKFDYIHVCNSHFSQNMSSCIKFRQNIIVNITYII